MALTEVKIASLFILTRLPAPLKIYFWERYWDRESNVLIVVPFAACLPFWMMIIDHS